MTDRKLGRASQDGGAMGGSVDAVLMFAHELARLIGINEFDVETSNLHCLKAGLS